MQPPHASSSSFRPDCTFHTQVTYFPCLKAHKNPGKSRFPRAAVGGRSRRLSAAEVRSIRVSILWTPYNLSDAGRKRLSRRSQAGRYWIGLLMGRVRPKGAVGPKGSKITQLAPARRTCAAAVSNCGCVPSSFQTLAGRKGTAVAPPVRTVTTGRLISGSGSSDPARDVSSAARFQGRHLAEKRQTQYIQHALQPRARRVAEQRDLNPVARDQVAAAEI